jgi:hypothetical protein
MQRVLYPRFDGKSTAPTLCREVGIFLPTGGPVMPIRPFRTPLRGTITIRVDDGLLEKIDELAVTLNRSRADMLRQLIIHARMTGLPDVAVDLPVEATST